MATTSDRTSRSLPGLLIALLVLVFVASIAHIAVGSFLWKSPLEVMGEILRGPGDSAFNNIVWQIRLPRALGCALVGGLLGAVGSAFQALFRNPLAEPYVVGVSSGAAAGGTAALVLGFAGAAGGFGVLLAAFAGGAFALVLVLSIAGRRGAIHVQTLLLAGVVVGTLLASMMSFMLLLAGQDTNTVLRWLMGSTSELGWDDLGVLLGALVLGTALLVRQSKSLNAFAVGELAAQRLGVDVERLKWIILGTGAAMTAVSVGTCGIIGFLGLVAPHISRRVLGVDWRWSLIGSALIGASLLLLADLAAQRILPGSEMPVGIVTAIVGAPCLLILLRKP